MTTGEALSGILKLMPVVLLLVIALWRMHPVIFQMVGGFLMVVAMYMPDILNDGVTDEISLASALVMMMFGWLCLAMAFGTLLRRARGYNDA